jgi:hypothetical protein
MNRFAFLSAILLSAGCAGRSAVPTTAATAPHTQPAHATSPQVVELRHFYLLSPGPNSRLVVTRSDLATGATHSSEASTAKAEGQPLGLQ